MDQNNYNSNNNQNPEHASQSKSRPYEQYQSNYNQEGSNNMYQQEQSSNEGSYTNQRPVNEIPYIHNPNYNQQPSIPPVSFLDWLGSFLAMCVPCLNIILLIFWAVSSNTNPSKQNYARAILALIPISFILVIILSFALASLQIY